jgi:myosin heavy subunit
VSLSLPPALTPFPSRALPAQELWRAATITDETTDADGKQMCTCLTCDDDAQTEVVVDRAELLLRDVLPPEGVDDLVSLGNLHAPAILDNLRLRFVRPAPDTGRHKSIYTYCGNICIAINPYERLHHLYSQECRDSYINQESFGDNPPHIYAVAEAAYSNMMRSGSTEVRPARRAAACSSCSSCSSSSFSARESTVQSLYGRAR